MGWLDERIIQYLYSDGETDMIIEAPASEPIPKASKGFTYQGMLPYKINLMTKVQYEQNGRQAYKIDVGTGKHIYRSATREKYEHNAGNMGLHQYNKEKSQGTDMSKLTESKYTKAYDQKVKQSKKDTTAMHTRNLTKILKGGR